MTTFVTADALGFTNLSPALPDGLLLTEQFEKAAFLICGNPEKFAVCLEAGSGFTAFEVDQINDAWRGCFVTGVRLQADISSASTPNQRDIRPGDLVISNATVSVASKPIQLGHFPRLIAWGDAAVLGSGNVRGSFSRWRVVRIENETISVLKEVSSQT